MKVKQNRFDFILNLVICVLALYFFIRESNIPVATEFNIPTVAKSRTYIRFITAGMVILSGILVIRAGKSLIKKDSEKTVSMLPREVIISIVAFLLYLLLMNFLGFYLDSFLFIFILLIVFRLKEKDISKPSRDILKKEMRVSLIFSVVALIVLHLLFVTLLGVIVPKGVFGFF